MRFARVATTLAACLTIIAAGNSLTNRVHLEAAGHAPAASMSKTPVRPDDIAQPQRPRRTRHNVVVRVYQRWTNHRIEATKRAIIASLTLEPDNVDARDHLWQRLHRLQSRFA